MKKICPMILGHISHSVTTMWKGEGEFVDTWILGAKGIKGRERTDEQVHTKNSNSINIKNLPRSITNLSIGGVSIRSSDRTRTLFIFFVLKQGPTKIFARERRRKTGFVSIGSSDLSPSAHAEIDLTPSKQVNMEIINITM